MLWHLSVLEEDTEVGAHEGACEDLLNESYVLGLLPDEVDDDHVLGDHQEGLSIDAEV